MCMYHDVLEAGGVGDMCMHHDVLESDVQSAAQDPHAYAALLRGEKSSNPREYCRDIHSSSYLCVFPRML